jgi:hypothetical protein
VQLVLEQLVLEQLVLEQLVLEQLVLACSKELLSTLQILC